MVRLLRFAAGEGFKGLRLVRGPRGAARHSVFSGCTRINRFNTRRVIPVPDQPCRRHARLTSVFGQGFERRPGRG